MNIRNRSPPNGTQDGSGAGGAVGEQGLAVVVEDGAVLQPQRWHDRADALGETTTRGAVIDEAYLLIAHRPERRTPRAVIGRCHDLHTGKGPQGRVDRRYIPAETPGTNGVAGGNPCQCLAKFLNHGQDRRLQFRPNGPPLAKIRAERNDPADGFSS